MAFLTTRKFIGGLSLLAALLAPLSASVLTFQATGTIQELGDNGATPNLLLSSVFAVGDPYVFEFTYEADPNLNPSYDTNPEFNIYHITSLKLTVQSHFQGTVVAGAYGDSTLSITDVGAAQYFRVSSVNTDGYVGAHTFYTIPFNPYTDDFWLLMDLQGPDYWTNMEAPLDFGSVDRWIYREVVFFLGDISEPHRISMSVDTLGVIPEPAHYATGLSAAALLGAMIFTRRRATRR